MIIRSRYFPPGQAADAAALATRLQAEFSLPNPRLSQDFTGPEYDVKADEYRLAVFTSFEGGWWVELSRREADR